MQSGFKSGCFIFMNMSIRDDFARFFIPVYKYPFFTQIDGYNDRFLAKGPERRKNQQTI
jgi:hypothetical protein